ncbi:MAG: DNA translocase FtsK [Nitrospirae bacterium]|nr:DNA translocase FtsK [Nitrospirota bacterium]
MAEKKAKREQKKWISEIWGLVFFAAGLIIFASLISFSPDDPSFNSISTSNNVKNLAGLLGSYLSDILFTLAGGAAYLVPFVLFLAGWKKFKREEASHIERVIGFCLLFLSLPTFLHLNLGRFSLSIKGSIPAGGLIGDLIASLLTGCCAKFGAHVIAFTLVVISAVIAIGISPADMSSAILRRAGFFLQLLKGRLSVRDRKKKVVLEGKPVLSSDKGLPEEEQYPEEPELDLFRPEPVIQQRNRNRHSAGDSETVLMQENLEFSNTSPDGSYKLPPLSILSDPPQSDLKINKEDLLMNSNILEKKLLDFGIDGQVVEVNPGPVITMYEFEPAPGVKLSRIVNLSDDLALALKSGSVRIVAPLPGKSTVGIEVPNHLREDVFLKEIIASEQFRALKSRLPLALGKDISGNPVVADMTRMPHLLVAGATGSGKSVALNSMISSLIYSATPSELKIVMIDPKILELSIYEGIPHLITPVITQPKEASWILQRLVEEMQRRYRVLAEKGVRNIDGYNKLPDKEETLPYIVVIVDELADLMMTAQREVEDSIARLAQMARAAGIHLILATQRPSVDVITGVIKANFPARISFKVSSKVDSRTILDGIGAEDLLDKGDMLFLQPGTSKLMRVHGAFIYEAEVKNLVDYAKAQASPEYSYKPEEAVSEEAVSEGDRDDEFYQQALDIVLMSGQASISLIQRRLRIGFNRAARLVEMMEVDGFVGPSIGGKPREVLKRESTNKQ